MAKRLQDQRAGGLTPFGLRNRIVGLSILGLTAVVSCGNDSEQRDHSTIAIGYIGDEEDKQSLNLLASTLRRINRAGGVELPDGPHELTLAFESHGGSVAGSVAALHRLADSGVTAIVGPPNSSMILGSEADHSDGAAQAAIERDVILITSSATSPLLSTLEDENRVWRTTPSDTVQANVSAQHLIKKGILSAGIIYVDDAWGNGLSSEFSQVFEREGGDVVSAVGYAPEGSTEHDFTAELTELFSKKPAAILLISFGEVLSYAQQIVVDGHLDAYGDNLPLFVGTDGFYDSNAIIQNFPDVILQRLIGTIPRSDPESANYRQLLSVMKEEELDFGTSADGSIYDAMMLLALAIQDTGSTAALDIAVALKDITHADDANLAVNVDEWNKAREASLAGLSFHYTGATGDIEFSPEGDRTKGAIGIWAVEAYEESYRIVDTELVRFDLDP